MILPQLYDFWFMRSGLRLRNLPFNWLPSDLGAGSLENSPKKAKCYVLKVKVIITQSSPTLCDPMDSSLPDSSAHEILQARILEWLAISFSRGSSRPRGRTWVSCIAGRFFTIWATRESLSILAYLVGRKNFTWESRPKYLDTSQANTRWLLLHSDLWNNRKRWGIVFALDFTVSSRTCIPFTSCWVSLSRYCWGKKCIYFIHSFKPSLLKK